MGGTMKKFLLSLILTWSGNNMKHFLKYLGFVVGVLFIFSIAHTLLSNWEHKKAPCFMSPSASGITFSAGCSQQEIEMWSQHFFKHGSVILK